LMRVFLAADASVAGPKIRTSANNREARMPHTMQPSVVGRNMLFLISEKKEWELL